MTRLTTIEEVLELAHEAKVNWMPGLTIHEDKEDVWSDAVLWVLQEGQLPVTKAAVERKVKNEARNKARDNERFESL